MRYVGIIVPLFAVVACASLGPTRSAEKADDRTPMVPSAMPRHRLVSEQEEVRGPSTPALRALQGTLPMVHAIHWPWSDDGSSVSGTFQLAVFEDGTVAYEGDACASAGPLIVTRLDRLALGRLRDLIGKSCVRLPVQPHGYACSHGGVLEVTCAGPRGVVRGEDRCGGRYDPEGTLRAFVKDLVDEVGISRFCARAIRGVAAGEVARTIHPERRRVWLYAPK